MGEMQVEDKVLRDLAQYLSLNIAASIEARSGPLDIWAQNEAVFRGDFTVQVDPSMVPVQVPFSAVRQQRITSAIAGAIRRQSAYVTATGDLFADSAQDLIQQVWDRAGFLVRCQSAALIATNTNLSVWRISLKPVREGSYCPIKIEVIHPSRFVIWPETLSGIAGATGAGHCFDISLREIKRKQDAGEYFPTTQPVAESYEDDWLGNETFNATVQNPWPDRDDAVVKLHEVVFRYDLGDGEKWYIATIAHEQQMLLALEPWGYDCTGYFSSNLITDETAYWTGRSISRYLAPVQDAFCKNLSLLYNAGWRSASQPMFGPDISNGEKETVIKAGEYLPIPPGTQVFSPTFTFNGQYIIGQLQMLEQIGDQIARLSANLLGQDQGDITKAQTTAINSGAGEGLDAFLQVFCAPFAEMAAFTFELLRDNQPLWVPLMDGLPENIEQVMAEASPTWIGNDADASQSPQARQQAAYNFQTMLREAGLPPSPTLLRVAARNSGISGSEEIINEVFNAAAAQPDIPPDSRNVGESGVEPAPGSPFATA